MAANQCENSETPGMNMRENSSVSYNVSGFSMQCLGMGRAGRSRVIEKLLG